MSDQILILGAGKMVEAILVGLSSSMSLGDFIIYSPSGESARKLAEKVGATHVTDLDELRPRWVLVGCKPQQLKDLRVTIGDRFQNALFVSLLAAVPEEDQCSILGVRRLIRCMPNLPVRLQQGVTLLSSESARSELTSFQELFSKLGVGLLVSEEELEELTLLTGSGPAFFYEFARHFAASFSSLDQKRREELVRQVLSGAAASVRHESSSLQELTNSVTSRGGVTIAVLDCWRESGFKELIEKGVLAGKKRARELKSLLLQK